MSIVPSTSSVRLALAMLVTCALLQPNGALADNVNPDCASDPACLSLYERAKRASADGQTEEALRLYKLAHEVVPDPLLQYSIARILHKQGKGQEAVPYYLRFLAAPTDDPEPQRKAREYLAQIRGANGPAAAPTPLPDATGPASTANPSPPSTTPLYKKWWFWTAIIGGAAVITGVGIGIGLAALPMTGTPSDPNAQVPAGVPIFAPNF